jgi:hypothetical protein
LCIVFYMDSRYWVLRKNQGVIGYSKNELADKIFRFAAPLPIAGYRHRSYSY